MLLKRENIKDNKVQAIILLKKISLSDDGNCAEISVLHGRILVLRKVHFSICLLRRSEKRSKRYEITSLRKHLVNVQKCCRGPSPKTEFELFTCANCSMRQQNSPNVKR